MKVEKIVIRKEGAIPFMAALPYLITIEESDESEVTDTPQYDAISQMTVYSMGRDYSTSREDESVFRIFGTKSDTKKDD